MQNKATCIIWCCSKDIPCWRWDSFSIFPPWSSEWRFGGHPHTSLAASFLSSSYRKEAAERRIHFLSMRRSMQSYSKTPAMQMLWPTRIGLVCAISRVPGHSSHFLAGNQRCICTDDQLHGDVYDSSNERIYLVGITGLYQCLCCARLKEGSNGFGELEVAGVLSEIKRSQYLLHVLTRS